MPRRAAIPALLATILASLTIGAGAAGAAATVTVGAALPTTEVQVPDGCNQPAGCAVVILDAPAPSSGTASPFDGTVTSWRIGGASAIPGYTIAAVRPNPGGTYTVTATEAPVTPTGGPETFSANLPIAAGEYVAIDIPYEGEISVIEGTSENAGFVGSLQLGETRSPSNVSELTAVLSFAATIDERVPTPPPADTTPPPSPATSASPSPASPAPPAEPPHCVVPKLAGKSLKAAKKTLRRADCGVGFVIRPAVHRPARRHRKPLKVRAESPRPGKSLPVGTEITVKLG